MSSPSLFFFLFLCIHIYIYIYILFPTFLHHSIWPLAKNTTERGLWRMIISTTGALVRWDGERSRREVGGCTLWLLSMGWLFMVKSTGNPRFSYEIWDFPVIFPLNQSIDLSFYLFYPPHIDSHSFQNLGTSFCWTHGNSLFLQAMFVSKSSNSFPSLFLCFQLVGGLNLPLWKIWVRQLGWLLNCSQLNGKNEIHVPKHQRVIAIHRLSNWMEEKPCSKATTNHFLNHY